MHCSGKAWDYRVVVTWTKATQVFAKIRKKRFSYEAGTRFVSEFHWTCHPHCFLNGLLVVPVEVMTVQKSENCLPLKRFLSDRTTGQPGCCFFFCWRWTNLDFRCKGLEREGWFNELQTANIVQPIVSFWKSAFPFFSVLYQDTGNLSFCMKTFGLCNGWTMLANLSLNWSEVSSFNQFSVRGWFENSYSAKSEGRYCLS